MYLYLWFTTLAALAKPADSGPGTAAMVQMAINRLESDVETATIGQAIKQLRRILPVELSAGGVIVVQGRRGQ